MSLWGATGIARGALLYARVGRHLPTNVGTHSSIPAKAGVAFCCRGKIFEIDLTCLSLFKISGRPLSLEKNLTISLWMN
jgi:hypothetical protein